MELLWFVFSCKLAILLFLSVFYSFISENRMFESQESQNLSSSPSSLLDLFLSLTSCVLEDQLEAEIEGP